MTGRSLVLLSILGASVSLSGCSFMFGDKGPFRDRDGDYRKADSIKPLELPPGVRTEAIGELYPIPAITTSEFGYDVEGQYDVPRPMPVAVNNEEELVKIQRIGEETWILVNAAPGEVWPRVRNFLNANTLPVGRADIARGLIETNWLQFKADLSSYDRYRLQIDQGVQPDTTEIHVKHMSVPATSKPSADLAWPKTSSDTEREKWMLDELAASIASSATTGATSFLAQDIGGSVKANLSMLNGEPQMTINLDRVRTLATLGYAAKRDGFTTFESDSTAGLFYVQFERPEDVKPGWIKRMVGIKEAKVPTTPYTLDQLKTNLPEGAALDNAPQSDRKKEKVNPKAPGYLIVVTGVDGNYVVRIRDPYGKQLSPTVSRELLTVLRKNLI
jgi:outer membrane protein assembly factor BamC